MIEQPTAHSLHSDRLLWVFCPTRDRPGVLFKTLNALARDCTHGPPSRVVVIDDSVALANCAANRRIVEKCAGMQVAYHGRHAQQHLLEKLRQHTGAKQIILNRFLRPLGEESWDLGAIRNYGVCLALALAEADSVMVMVDDDVALASPFEDGESLTSSLATMRARVAREPAAIVGGHLDGMEDLSAVEREVLETRKALGLCSLPRPRPPVPVSGGMLAFSRVWGERLSFPRTYNEDWVWLLRSRALGARLVVSKARGIHAWCPHKPMLKGRLCREQFGEVFCEGWTLAYDRHQDLSTAHRCLGEPSFWIEVLQDERVYLHSMTQRLAQEAKGYECSKAEDRVRAALGILLRASSILKEVRPATLARVADNYIRSTNLWREFLRQIARVRWTEQDIEQRRSRQAPVTR